MDRVISLLAALVGLIALGGALLVHTNVEAERQAMAAEMAQLKLSVGLLAQQAQPGGSTTPAPTAAAPKSDDTSAAAIAAMQQQIAALEAITKQQASQLASQQVAAASAPPVGADGASASQPGSLDGSSGVAASSQPPASGATPAAIVANGPTKDCIPLGTRFVASAGDNFPICRTKLVVRVASVSDGIASVSGAGDVAPGAPATLDKGCQLTVFTADSSGYAEMRVTCQ